jgi:integrase
MEFAEQSRQRRVKTNANIGFATFAFECLDLSAVAPNTAAQRYSLLSNHILPFFGDISLASIRPDHIERFYRHLPLAASTKKTIRTLLNFILNKAVARELIFKNPGAGIVIKELPRIYQTLNEAEIIKFMKAAASSPYVYVYHLMLCSGLRRGEAFGITWETINFSRKFITVCKQVVMEAGKSVLKEQLKNTFSMRKIPLNDALLALLKQVPRSERCGLITPKPNDFRDFYKDFKRILRKINKNIGLRPHDLRHTFATVAQMRGVPLPDLSRLLGHSNPNITAKIYSHVQADYLKRNANIIDEIITEVR